MTTTEKVGTALTLEKGRSSSRWRRRRTLHPPVVRHHRQWRQTASRSSSGAAVNTRLPPDGAGAGGASGGGGAVPRSDPEALHVLLGQDQMLAHLVPGPFAVAVGDPAEDAVVVVDRVLPRLGGGRGLLAQLPDHRGERLHQGLEERVVRGLEEDLVEGEVGLDESWDVA